MWHYLFLWCFLAVFPLTIFAMQRCMFARYVYWSLSCEYLEAGPFLTFVCQLCCWLFEWCDFRFTDVNSVLKEIWSSSVTISEFVQLLISQRDSCVLDPGRSFISFVPQHLSSISTLASFLLELWHFTLAYLVLPELRRKDCRFWR